MIMKYARILRIFATLECTSYFNAFVPPSLSNCKPQMTFVFTSISVHVKIKIFN